MEAPLPTVLSCTPVLEISAAVLEKRRQDASWMVGTRLCGCTVCEVRSPLPAGGSLVLAEGGVCLVGNISRFKKDMKDKLQQSTFPPST